MKYKRFEKHDAANGISPQRQSHRGLFSDTEIAELQTVMGTESRGRLGETIMIIEQAFTEYVSLYLQDKLCMCSLLKIQKYLCGTQKWLR